MSIIKSNRSSIIFINNKMMVMMRNMIITAAVVISISGSNSRSIVIRSGSSSSSSSSSSNRSSGGGVGGGANAVVLLLLLSHLDLAPLHDLLVHNGSTGPLKRPVYKGHSGLRVFDGQLKPSQHRLQSATVALKLILKMNTGLSGLNHSQSAASL